MANEISISISLTATKNGATYTRTESFLDDMTGDAWTTGIVEITTSGVQMTDLDVGSYGWIFVKNLGTDSSIYIDIVIIKYIKPASKIDNFECVLNSIPIFENGFSIHTTKREKHMCHYPILDHTFRSHFQSMQSRMH